MAYQDFLNVRDRVAFGQGPYAASPSYTDITLPSGSADNAVRPGGTFASGRQNRNGAFEATSVTLDVGNRDGRYTPYYSASPYFPLTEFAPYQRHVEYPKSSGTWYPIWAGVLTDCEAGFEGAAQGTASLSFQQRLALPGLTPLRAMVAGQILATAPIGFWPFDDDADSTSARDYRGDDYQALTLASLAGPPSGGYSFDYSFGVAEGLDPGTTALALTSASNHYYGYCLDAAFAARTASSTHSASIALAPLPIPSTADPATVFAFYDSLNRGYQVTIRASGLPQVNLTTHAQSAPATSGGWPITDATVTGTQRIDDGEWHDLRVEISESAGTSTLNLIVDGVSMGTATFTTVSFDWNRILVGGGPQPVGYGEFFDGDLCNFAYWDTVSGTGTSISASTASVGAAGLYSTDTGDVRFERLAALAGIPPSWIDTVGTFTRTIGPQDTAGRIFGDCVKELEAAEVGRLYCDHEGKLVLASASAFYTPTRTLSLSATTHFTLTDSFGTDNDNLVNDWRGIRDGGLQQTYTASTASIEKRGQQSKDAGTLPLTTDDDVLEVGHWAVSTFSEPTLRFPKVAVHASKLHAAGLLDEALALVEGDQLVLTNLPTGSPVSSFTGFIERVERVFTNDALTLVFTLSAWIDIHEFDSATIGRFAEDEGTITLTSTVTNSATSISATTAAGSPPLTNAAGDLPFDISLNGERCTVTAVSAATSPQTLTVTRGVAPTSAVAHTAGAVISIWNPGVLGV